MRLRTVLTPASAIAGRWGGSAVADPGHPMPPRHRLDPTLHEVRPRLIRFSYRLRSALKGPVGVVEVTRLSWAGAPGFDNGTPPAWDGRSGAAATQRLGANAWSRAPSV
jgi:hypothetical protein